MVRRSARARRPRWSATWSTLCVLLLCLPKLASAALVTTEARQLKSLVSLALDDFDGQINIISDPCDRPGMDTLRDKGVYITCTNESDGEHVERLRLLGLQLNGSLEMLRGFNFTMIKEFKVEQTSLRGKLPDLAPSQSLATLIFESNLFMESMLPESWAGQFPSLVTLKLNASPWNGTLPASWGNKTSFPNLGILSITGPQQTISGVSGLTGEIPVSWGQNGSFPSLLSLDLSYNSLSGKVPEYLWRSLLMRDAPFPMLSSLKLFKQRGSQLCAHLSAAHLSETRTLEDWPNGLTHAFAAEEVLQEESSDQPFSTIGSAGCPDGLPGMSQSAVAQSAADYVHVGPGTLLPDPPVFMWPEQASSGRNEVFIGLCDLPEMLAFKYALHLSGAPQTSQCETLDYCKWPAITCGPNDTFFVSGITVDSTSVIPETSGTMPRNSLGFLPPLTQNSSLPQLASVNISTSIWGTVPQSWTESWRVPMLTDITLSGSNIVHALPEGLVGFDSPIEQLRVVTSMPVGCLPMYFGRDLAFKESSLKRLQIIEDPSNRVFDSNSMPRGHACPFPAMVTVDSTSVTMVNSHSEFAGRSAGDQADALRAVDELDISATAAQLDMTKFSCSQTTGICSQEDMSSSCVSWKKFDSREGQACGSASLPEIVVGPCDGSDTNAQSGCENGLQTSLGICLAEYAACNELPGNFNLHQSSTIVEPSDSAAQLPSGLYATALSAAIAAGSERIDDGARIVGGAAVTGLWRWMSAVGTPCEQLRASNATAILKDLKSSQPVEPPLSRMNISEVYPFLTSLRCDTDLSGGRTRAVEIPPWLQATHYHVQVYLLQPDAAQDGGVPLSNRVARRLLQHDFQVGSSSALQALHTIFSVEEARQAAEAAMKDALVQLTTLAGIDVPDTSASLLPDISSSTVSQENGGANRKSLYLALALCACGFVIVVLALITCCLLRRRTPPPSPRTYVASAEGASEPMLPPERREQLKGLLKWLRRKRTEEMIHARTRPLGEPVELGPEPAVRTKVEHIVKSLLCASAPSSGVAAEFALATPPMRRKVLTTAVAGVARQAQPSFRVDEPTLLKRLVLKGCDANKPAAARLSSANDLLFDGDPFGIYTTVQFQTNMWEMLLAYREEEREPWEPALPSRRFSCVGTLDFKDRFEEFRELQKRRMAVLTMMHALPLGNALGKLPRAASSGIPRSTSSLPPGSGLANINEEDAVGTSHSSAASAAGSQGSGTSGLAGSHLPHAATVPNGHMPSASLGSGSLMGNRAVSAAHVPGKAIFDEQSGPITEEKLETRRDLYKSVLSLDEGSLCGQGSFPRPSSVHAAHTPTESQAAYAPFGSLSSPGAEGSRTMDGADMSPVGLHSLKQSAFQPATEPSHKQGVRQAKASEQHISRSFSWPYCQALADMDFQAPRRDEDGMISTCAWPNGNAAFFLSTDSRHPMAFLGSVLFLGKRQQARLAGCVTAPFKPPEKLLGSNLQKRAADVSAKIAEAVPDGNGNDAAQTTDVSKLARQVAAEWRDGSTPATTSSDAPMSDTVPFFPGAPGTSARPVASDSGPVDGQSRGLLVARATVGRDYPKDNVYWPPPGFGQSGAPTQQGAEKRLPSVTQVPVPEAVEVSELAGTSGPLQGLRNLLGGSRAASREPASPAQPRGYIQLADVVNNLSGMQTGGQLPQSPVAGGTRLSAITPPDVVSTTNDGHSENGMLAAFTILGDCFQMIESKPSNMDAILAAAITEIHSVVSQQFNNERNEAEIDLGGIDMTGSIDMTTEPVQDPEVPDFVGGNRDDRRLGLGGLPPVSSGVSQDASTDAHPAEPSYEVPALPNPAPRIGPGLVDEDAAIDPSKLVYDSLLGRGAFGEVHYGRWEAPDGIIHEVAIKVLLATRYGSLREHEQDRAKFFKEMRLMMRMRHHSIVRCFGGAQAQQEGDRDVMVLEYIPGGTLDHYVHEHRRDNRLSLNEVLVIATDLADVLRYLHRNGIVHQDLKPSNILLNEKGEVKLTDFGISKIKRSTYLSRFMVGTPSYTAPEVWRADAVNEKCDMFALGILLWECMTGARPFKNMHAFQIMMHLQNKSRQNNADWLPFPSRTPDDFKRLIRRCWHAENRDRISAEEALASAVLLRTRIPESQLNEPVPLDQQSSRSRDPMMVPRAESRSILPGNTAANMSSNGKRPPNATSLQPQGDHTGFNTGGSVGNSGPRYMPASPRRSLEGRREEAQPPDQPGSGSTGPSAATWSVDLRLPTMKTTGWGPLGDSTHSALGMGASNSSLIRKKPETSASVSGSHSASRSASKSGVARHAGKAASGSGNLPSSHRAMSRIGARTPQEKLSVVPERSHADRFTSAGYRMPDVSPGSALRPGGPGRQQLQESMEPFDERAEYEMTADSQTAEGEEQQQGSQQAAPPLEHAAGVAASNGAHGIRHSAEYLPVLPSTQQDIIHDFRPPDAQTSRTGMQAHSPHSNSPSGMQPSRPVNMVNIGDGYYSSTYSNTRLPWVRTNETTVSVTLAQSEVLEDRPPPGQPGLAMHEAWSLASRPKT